MVSRGRILVVDDEVSARTALCQLLGDDGYEVETAADAFKALGTCASFAPHVVLTDLKMPGMDGVELIKKIKATDDPPTTLIMTAYGGVTSAVQAMRAGAADYLVKPINVDELQVVLAREMAHRALRIETAQLRERVRARLAPPNIIGSSPAMSRIFQIVEQVGPSKATVLITGESGTGKELIALALHERSPRATGPFIKLHCAALAESLLESELFGHEKGAFTGAVQRRDGRLQMADGGTLFLDEIGEVSPSIQVKLLRFLQEHELERVGSGQTVRVDVRVLAATNKNLEDAVSAGRFREDLYYRLNVVSLEMPALRDRRSDIPALARFFVERFARQNDRSIETISHDALEAMMTYDWPGNVRELENAIERAVVMTTGNTLEARHLPASIQPAAAANEGAPTIPGASMAEIERYAIVETLRATGGSTSRAAKVLGISVRTIQYRMQTYSASPRSNVAVVSDRASPA